MATDAAALTYTSGTVTTADGLALFTQCWEPEATPKALVVLVHGYAEHSGRYAHVAAFLGGEGYAVCAYDQRGYGKSEGYPAYVERIEQYQDDLDRVIADARTRFPEVPWFLFGHSMGGLVASLYVLNHARQPHGLLLSSPAFRSFEPVLLQRLSGLLGALFPKLPTVPLKRATISRDARIVTEALDDPLNYHGRFLARTGAEIVRGMRQLNTRAAELRLPFLAFHGTADALIDPTGTIAAYEAARSADKTLKLYEGLYHETLNEPERAEVLALIADWLKAHI